MITLYDSMSKEVKPLELREPGKVSLYVCGPTVYDAPHIGHGRFVLVYDALRRYLQWSGLEVDFVSNITDIDDKIIVRANEEDSDIFTVAKHWEQVWWDTMDRLNVMRPDETPHATDYVEQMVNFVSELLDARKAYETADGIYLFVEMVDNYGSLSNQTLDELIEGAGDRDVVGLLEKQHPADFVLWKFSKEGEPSWPAPFGDGRPGWHTECVVMSLDILGEGFDLHTGGLDLKFPHHENECAQATAAGKKFANHWMHNGFVESAGEKMSKSIGNTLNLLELTEKYDPRAYRLLILQTHYRSPIEVTPETLEAASVALERIDVFARRISSIEVEGSPDRGFLADFRRAVDADFDTVAGVEMIFNAVRSGNTALDSGDNQAAADLFANMSEYLVAFGLEIGSEAEISAEVQELVDRRDRARADKDYDLSDQIRDELVSLGWLVEDRDGKTEVHKA